MERPKYRAVLRRSTKETTSESSTVARAPGASAAWCPPGPRGRVKTAAAATNMAIAQYHYSDGDLNPGDHVSHGRVAKGPGAFADRLTARRPAQEPVLFLVGWTFFLLHILHRVREAQSPAAPRTSAALSTRDDSRAPLSLLSDPIRIIARSILANHHFLFKLFEGTDR